MRFILMMHAPGGAQDYQINKWSPDDFTAHIAFMRDLNRELTNNGELVGAEGLAPPSEAKVVRAGKDGMPAVTDGPFPETKEFLAGYWMVEVDRPERAYEIAAKASAAPGPGGVPLNMPIEVRQVMRAPAPADV
ncbi:MAG TPA: YciI family protein [Gemmatimonadaceae bacterium]